MNITKNGIVFTKLNDGLLFMQENILDIHDGELLTEREIRHFQRKRHKNKDFSPVHRKFKRKYIPTELKKKELLRPKKELSERLLKYLKRRPRRRNLKKVIPIPENLKFRKATKFSKKEKRQAERFFIKNHRGISDGYNCKERRKKRREQIKNTTKCDQKKELTYSSTT